MRYNGRTRDTTRLHAAFRAHRDHAKTRLSRRHPHAQELFRRLGIAPETIREYAAKLLASGALAGTMVLAAPAVAHLPNVQSVKIERVSQQEREKRFASELSDILPSTITPLSSEQEASLHNLVETYWNLDARASFQDHRLNHVFGTIGAEQHLPRFQADTVSAHDRYQEAGITPNRGAWGYFVDSKQSLTPTDIEREKYYVAVQTLYLPQWNTNWKELKEWYKFRKVLVINPKNGKTIVCDIADAGPAQWTGKHFGGSPEVMGYLELRTGKQKGDVILMFLNDEDDRIPLGPVRYNENSESA